MRYIYRNKKTGRRVKKSTWQRSNGRNGRYSRRAVKREIKLSKKERETLELIEEAMRESGATGRVKFDREREGGYTILKVSIGKIRTRSSRIKK